MTHLYYTHFRLVISLQNEEILSASQSSVVAHSTEQIDLWCM